MEATSLFQQAGAATGLAPAVGQTWKRGPEAPVLWPNEVHVWRARLDAPWSWTLDEALSLEDRERAARYKFESDRRRFCLARASLRLILGRYLKVKPVTLAIEQAEYGKPFLANTRLAQGLRFNLSHSHQLALIAVARDRELGIDIEYMRPDFVTEDIANHFFSPAEVADFLAVPGDLKTRSFFNCWTRKEAYIKARGEGMYCPLDQFDVSVTPGAAPMLLGNRLDTRELARWNFRDLAADAGYAATVAVEGECSRLVLWDFV